ncbi:MAG: sugar phosphate isomerase/epimerase [Clostridia bacterium]|nr:sugar phosphate isomerase/epimerase [Clostridia bacterium]
MKKGISIWSFKKDTLAEAFALAKDAGFDGVEVALAEDGEINLSTTEKELLEIKKQAENAGIELYSVASGLYWQYSLTDDRENMRQKAKDIVKKQLQTAAVLGCDTILVVPGAVRVDFAPELGIVDYSTAYSRSLEAFGELKSEAEKMKVAIGIENVWNRFLVSPLEMRDFIDKIGSGYVGSYFDVGNVLFNGEPEHWIRALGSRIKKVHLKDYRKNVGTLDGFVDLLAGDVNYPSVMKAFREIGYDGWVSAEMIPPYNYLPDTLIYNTSKAMDAILAN